MNTTEFKEALVEYDNDTLEVFLSGLTEEGTWLLFQSWENVNSPEDFAHGVGEVIAMSDLTVQVVPAE